METNMTQTYLGTTPRYEAGQMTSAPPSFTEPQQRPEVNVGHGERMGSLAGGVALALLGLKVRGLTGLAMMGGGYLLAKRGYTGHCAVYSRFLHSTANPPEPEQYHERGIHVEVALTINKPRSELFAFWRKFENLPRFMQHLESVTPLEDNRSHWVAKGPAGTTVEWDAEIINEEKDELIAWRSLGGATVDNAGSVRFVDAPGDRGTEVRVVLDYIPPAGRVGKWVAMAFGEAPEQTIREDLRRFKQLMETGEVPTVEGQSKGSCC
jgi:uncharacterized membrane protein